MAARRYLWFCVLDLTRLVHWARVAAASSGCHHSSGLSHVSNKRTSQSTLPLSVVAKRADFCATAAERDCPSVDAEEEASVSSVATELSLSKNFDRVILCFLGLLLYLYTADMVVFVVGVVVVVGGGAVDAKSLCSFCASI